MVDQLARAVARFLTLCSYAASVQDLITKQRVILESKGALSPVYSSYRRRRRHLRIQGFYADAEAQSLIAAEAPQSTSASLQTMRGRSSSVPSSSSPRRRSPTLSSPCRYRNPQVATGT
jgi:hypothetical protein